MYVDRQSVRGATGERPQIWIGCLAAYNGGDLHGEWVDASDADEIAEAAGRIIATSPAPLAEEYFVADYNAVPRAVIDHFGEYPDFERLAAVCAALEEASDRGAFEAWLQADEDALDDFDPDRFAQVYRGQWPSEADFAEEQVCQVGWWNVPAQVYTSHFEKDSRINVFEELSALLDFETIARDFFQHGPYTSVDDGGNVYVFELGA
jgi:antirestriction protein